MKLRGLQDRFVRAWFEFHPPQATEKGFPGLDQATASYTRDRVEQFRELVGELSLELGDCPQDLPLDEQLDFEQLRAYLESALRVEDQIFRMTRERAVLYFSDVDATRAAEVLVRIFGQFCDEFPTAEPPEFAQRMLEVRPGLGPLSVKEVLTSVFGSKEMMH